MKNRKKCKGTAAGVKAPARRIHIEYIADEVRFACDRWLKRRGLV